MFYKIINYVTFVRTVEVRIVTGGGKFLKDPP